jgi:hypothetical protein
VNRSVAESFSLFPLSKYFVVKTTGAGFNYNVGVTQPIASERIENDAVNNIGGVTGYYTWYRLSQYGGNPGTQGAELRKYLIVCRNVSTTSNNPSFQLAILDGGFAPSYNVFRSLYDQTSATTPGSGTHTWTLSFPNNTYIQINTSTTLIPRMKVSSSISWAYKFNQIEGDPSIHVQYMYTLSFRSWIIILILFFLSFR